MMENFNVTLSGLTQGMEEEQKMTGTLSGLAEGISSVRNSLSFRVRGRENLQHTLKRLADEVSGYSSDMRKMRSALRDVRDEYEKTERRICGYVNDPPITIEDIWDAVTTAGKGLAVSAMVPGLDTVGTVVGILKDEEWERESTIGSYGHTILEGLDKKKKDNRKKEHYELENWKLVKKKTEESDEDKEKTGRQKRKEVLENITLWSGSLQKEGSLLHFGKDGDVETGWGSYTYSADSMKAEAHMSAELTLGGVEAEIGMALTAFTAHAAGQLGSDMFGMHGDAGVSVGKTEAKGKIGLGIWDKDGNFNPKAKAELSVEAILAEASATGGVDLLGTKVDATGSVNFGVGGHLDVGFDNGKLSVDVGASLGVGGSLKLDIDMSGTVEKLDEALDVASDTYSAVSGFVEDSVNAVGDFAKGAADAVGDTAEKIWNKATRWFRW